MALASCADSPSKGGVPWWPQGPGDVDDSAAEDRDRTPVDQDAGDAGNPPPVRVQATEPAAPRSRAPVVAVQREHTDAIAPQPVVVPAFARYGDLLFVSGQIADEMDGAQRRPASIEDETRSVMGKIRLVLEAQHLTMTNIVSTTIYLTDLNDLPAVEPVYDSYFRSARPASSIIEVRRLPGNARLQIAAVAGR
jgi:2-iminobutanoate/2-iminopropanoate deaminase